MRAGQGIFFARRRLGWSRPGATASRSLRSARVVGAAGGSALLCVLLCVLLGGCWWDGLLSSTPPGDQVAVKVNSDVISAQQVSGLMQGAPANLTSDQQVQAAGQATVNLIDQQLLTQQALEHKLDRDPQVAAALATARAKILAQAYLQKTLLAGVKPTDQAVREYFDGNPALFAQRRVYALQEIDVPAISGENAELLEGLVRIAKSLHQVTQWLQDSKIEYTVKDGVRGAEQLPLTLLPKVAQLKDGQIGILLGNGRATILVLVHSEDKPLTLEQARPAIERFLANRQGEQMASAEIQRLRQTAKLEFQGDYTRFSTLVLAKPEAPPAAATAAAK
jgi:EpsD family peptidyl-prolyl cis-trans isomerase